MKFQQDWGPVTTVSFRTGNYICLPNNQTQKFPLLSCVKFNEHPSKHALSVYLMLWNSDLKIRLMEQISLISKILNLISSFLNTCLKTSGFGCLEDKYNYLF
jgi:hypothetical protein